MSIAEMVANGRTLVEDTFIDVGTITRKGGPMVHNPVTHVSAPSSPLTIYSGRCRVKKPSTEEMQRIWGDTDVSVQRRIVRLPFDAPEVNRDDIFRATSSADAEVLRQSMRVAAVVAGSMNMYRDFGCEVVKGNGE